MKKHLHNWMIPHKGNNHKPHILHHHHLAAHTVVALVLKGMFMLTIFALPSSMLLASDALIKQRAAIIDMTNAIRSSLGLERLVEHSGLNQAAEAKAAHMSELGYFSHYGPDGKTHKDWLDQVGYDYRLSGENLAVGFSTAQGAVNGWQKSPSHYANIIDPSYTETGVGVVPGEYKGKDTNFIAQFFSSRKGSGTIEQKQQISSQIQPEKSHIKATETSTGLQLDIVTFAEKDTEIVEIFFNGKAIELTQDELEKEKWVGQTLLTKEEADQINPLVLATAVSKNSSGEVDMQDIALEQPGGLFGGLYKNYQYYKTHPSELLQTFSDFIQSYFVIIISLLTLSLVFGIFTEMKKKHPHVVASSMGVILLLLVLIKF